MRAILGEVLEGRIPWSRHECSVSVHPFSNEQEGEEAPLAEAACRNLGLHKMGSSKGQTPGRHRALCSQQLPVSPEQATLSRSAVQ